VLATVTLIVHVVGVTIFLVSWAIAAVSYGTWFAEGRANRRLEDRYFDRGQELLRRTVTAQPPQAVGAVVRLEHARLRAVGPARALLANTGTGLVKGVVSWAGSDAQVVVRRQVHAVRFMHAWRLAGYRRAAWSFCTSSRTGTGACGG
jgi:hypothetical protein